MAYSNSASRSSRTMSACRSILVVARRRRSSGPCGLPESRWCRTGPSCSRHVLTNDAGSEICTAGADGSMLIGADVEPEVGRDLLQIEPADAADVLVGQRTTAWPARSRASSSGSTARPSAGSAVPWTSITAAFACRSRWTRKSMSIGRGFLSRLFVRADDLRLAPSRSRRSAVSACRRLRRRGSAGPSSAKNW